MEPPVPPPRRKSSTKLINSDGTDLDELGSSSPFFQNKTIQLVHTAEVHNSLGGTPSKSDEGSKSSEKKRKKVKRKGTYSVSKKNSPKPHNDGKASGEMEIQSLSGSPKISHSGTETLSEASLSPASNKIKLIPLIGNEKRKKPSGYATETLSEDSGPEEIGPPSSSLLGKSKECSEYVVGTGDPASNSEKISTPTKSVDIFQESNPRNVIEDTNSIPSPFSENYTPPKPLPRKSLTKSSENLIAEKLSAFQGSPQSYCTTSSLEYKDTGGLPKQRPKKQRKRKKKSEQNIQDSSQADSEEDAKSERSSPSRSQPFMEPKRFTEDLEEKCICLTVHNCEPLKAKHISSRPFVKITFMDIETGKPKCNSKGEAISPLVTQAYDFAYQRSAMPIWNEDLIVGEPLELIHNPNTLIIIEILSEEKEKGICWGFLKPVAANGVSNSGKMLRLQLFKQGSYSNKDNTVPPPFYWWKKKEFKKYKGTFFITLSGIPRSMIVENIVGEQPMKNEVPVQSPEKSFSENLSENDDRDLEDVKWSRLPSLSCKLPNKYLARLPAGPDGSIAIAYSHSGLLLASANKINISVFTFRGRPYLSLQGHTGLVYSLKWSPSDKYLLSASADFTSCVWDVSKKNTAPLQVVSHPSYVYCCAWLDNTTFATGCFDSDIRIWKLGSTSVHQQASRHHGQINTLLTYDCYLLSGDSSGAIFIWQWDNSGYIQFERELTVREIKGKVINKVSIHPGKKRILVHTRDSVLRMVDLASASVLHWFQGLVNTKLREDSTFCGCGSLVLAWSEDSTLCAWDSNTGAQAAIYPGLIPDSRPGVVDFHPRDHMMAVSAHSSLAPTLSILTFDRKSNGREVSLVLLNGNMNTTLNGSELRLPNSDRSSESTPRKKEGSLLKTLLRPRRKIKKENSETPSIENSFTDFSRIQGLPTQLDMVDEAGKESRLTDIIKRMDIILTAVSQNNGLVYTSS